MSDIKHSFGNINTWTKSKLDKVEKYLKAYVTALKKQNFRLAYIDAFAGNGYVTKKINQPGQSLFEQDELLSLKYFIDGSARLALQVEPPFHKYIFIEKSKKRCKELEVLKQEFSSLAERIEIVNADANDYIKKLCEKDWIKSRTRAVMFADPYGTQVDWETIESISETKAIDLWILFPIGTVNRLLNRNGKIIESRKRKLNKFFGDDEWFSMFFEKSKNEKLFSGDEEPRFVKKTSFEKIALYYNDKLKTIFAGVAPNPLILTNSTNSPIFVLYFAAGNTKGAEIAVKIAENILKKR